MVLSIYLLMLWNIQKHDISCYHLHSVPHKAISTIKFTITTKFAHLDDTFIQSNLQLSRWRLWVFRKDPTMVAWWSKDLNSQPSCMQLKALTTDPPCPLLNNNNNVLEWAH